MQRPQEAAKRIAAYEKTLLRKDAMNHGIRERILLISTRCGVLCAAIALTTGVRAQSLDELLAKGGEQLRAGDWAAAVDTYTKAVQADGRSAKAHAEKVRALLENYQVHEAEQSSKTALAAAPKSPEVLEAVGEVEFRMGRMQQAADSFESALQIDENCARVWLGMAEINRVISNHKRAHEMIEKAHSIDADDPDILEAWAHEQKKAADEVPALQRVLVMRTKDRERHRAALQNHIEFLSALKDRPVYELASPYAASDIRLREIINGPNRRGGWAVEVRVNGRKADLQLDTGASGLMIRRSPAGKMGLEKLSDERLSGIGNEGDRRGYTALADEVQIGGVVLKHVPVRVSPSDMGDPDTQGLIGTNLLSDFLISLDFKRRTIHLEPFPDGKPDRDTPRDRVMPAKESGFQPVFRMGHLLLVSTRAADRAGLFGIDTGAWATTLSSEFARLAARKQVGDSDLRIRGVSGEVKNVKNTSSIVLEFAGFRQLNRDVTTFDFTTMNNEDGFEMAGLLGRPVLNLFRLTLDYQNGLVRWEYQP